MNSPRKYPQADIKILYAKAAGRCSFETCRKDIVLEAESNDKTKQIGKIAHIVAHSSDGPRANPNYPKDKLDSYENWILLCPTCHDTIDAQESKYTVEGLIKIKTDHETWVTGQLDQGLSDITFAELEIAAKAIASGKHSNNGDFQVIPPEQKITKNGLTEVSRSYIAMGLSRSFEVGRFLVSMTQLDDQYPERLKSGFRQKYMELKKSICGDELFMAMLEFSQVGHTDFKQQAASLAILSHLFHLCEVFEK
ncbi:MAG: HNH endonuclease [Gammaproteobacteria bacterium]